MNAGDWFDSIHSPAARKALPYDGYLFQRAESLYSDAVGEILVRNPTVNVLPLAIRCRLVKM